MSDLELAVGVCWSLSESVGVQECSLLQASWFEAAPASLVGSAAPLAGPRRTPRPDLRRAPWALHGCLVRVSKGIGPSGEF